MTHTFRYISTIIFTALIASVFLFMPILTLAGLFTVDLGPDGDIVIGTSADTGSTGGGDTSGGSVGTGGGDTSGGITNPLKFNSISEFLNAILDVIILVSVPIIVLFIVYAGFLFISAQGDVSKLDTAKKVITYTIIGAVLILGAKVLAVAIQATVSELQSLRISETHISLEQTPWEA